MKNSPLSALVLLGIAGLVGGVAYMASGDERIEAKPDVVAAPRLKTPKVMAITPRERQMEKLLERSRQKIENYRKAGKVLANGSIKVMDDDGTPLYVHPELLEGVGRYGEPLYMMASYKRKAAVPLVDRMQVPDDRHLPKVKRLPQGQTALTMGGKRPGSGKKMKGQGGGGGGGSKPNGKSPMGGPQDGPQPPTDG